MRVSPASGATPRAGGHPEGSGVFQKDFPLRAVLSALPVSELNR